MSPVSRGRKPKKATKKARPPPRSQVVVELPEPRRGDWFDTSTEHALRGTDVLLTTNTMPEVEQATAIMDSRFEQGDEILPECRHSVPSRRAAVDLFPDWVRWNGEQTGLPPHRPGGQKARQT